MIFKYLSRNRKPQRVRYLLLVFATVSGMLLGGGCRLNESPDAFSKGEPTAGFGGAGSGGGGLGEGIQCEKSPMHCEEFAGDSARLLGCCEDNMRWWCERVQGDWRLRSEDCELNNAECGYDARTGALRCMSGQEGTGGAMGGSGGGETGGTGGETGGTGGATGGTGGSTGGTGGTGGCSTGCGALEECGIPGYCVAKSVLISKGYFIDATEVTRSQYEAWLSTNPSTAGQPAVCSSWNSTYHPDGECMKSEKSGGGYQGPNSGNHPVVCVDWCDAYAYCKAIGKRLCGKIGGGANGYDDYKDASTSQWYAACSSGGKYEYPYGDTYEGQACNGQDKGVGTTSEVGSLSGCQSSASGYEGVYDMSGNVWEWEDSCDGNTGKIDKCSVRGGSIGLGEINLRCGSNGDGARDNNGDSTGFRCCSAP